MNHLSILIPTYNGAHLLRQTLESILKQNFHDYEIVIGDDASTDDTEEIVASFQDPRIQYFKNAKNLGYGANLNACLKHATGEIIFLMGHDDILLEGALLKTVQAFDLSSEVGVVTRPYYWFYDAIHRPVRVVRPYDQSRDCVLSVFDGQKQVNAIFKSVGQLSGLAYRRSLMDIPFHEEIFPAHIYPFASILKKYKVVYLKDYTVAVRIESSMTRHRPQIYDISPTDSWVRMFKAVYSEEAYKTVRRQGIKHITTNNFVGLVQLKNYASVQILLREILILVKYRWQNVFSIEFWCYSLGVLIVPRHVLIRSVDFFKKKILVKQLQQEIVTTGVRI